MNEGVPPTSFNRPLCLPPCAVGGGAVHEGMSASEMNHNARMPAHRHKRCTHADKAHRTSAERPGPGELCDAFGAKRRRQLGASDLQAARAGHKKLWLSAQTWHRGPLPRYGWGGGFRV